jgi:hypothetical protein
MSSAMWRRLGREVTEIAREVIDTLDDAQYFHDCRFVV